ncbi:2-aminomuconate deaminase [Diplonema papillatum]|nr:2-aminomuconate deaminase [Diplonema papillatum]KAJ9453100.1 2-aminomuconate deaminase [Diplonema papillatum]KAJ9453102.1 2-aminomuconate deaminase [Diplonema papillatum]
MPVRHGNLLFLDGIGPQNASNNIPGGATHDDSGKQLSYDAYQQTRSAIGNVRAALKEAGGEFTDIVDVQCFLVNMRRDFKGFNRAYKEGFIGTAATRTTVSVRALPGPFAVQLKVIARAPGSTTHPEAVTAVNAPVAVGAYPHAKRYGDLLFVSGMGPRDPQSNQVPGGPIWDKDGKPLEYDVGMQTKATIDNIRQVLEASGSRMEDIIDVNCFLVNMPRDFRAFNQVYREELGAVAATRTTFSVRSLPTPIAVEMKVIVKAPNSAWKSEPAQIIETAGAPAPVGAYPHARRFGDLLFISGMGPRDPKTNGVPGGPVYDKFRNFLPYDIERQTQSCIDNIEKVLRSCGARLEDVVDVQCYLIDMKADYTGFDKVYQERFGKSKPARTTMAIRALPTPIAVEMKCIARAPLRGGKL